MLPSGSDRRRGEWDCFIARSMSGCNWLLLVMIGKTVNGPADLEVLEDCDVCWDSGRSHWIIRALISSEP